MPRHIPPCDALRHKQRVRVIAAVLIVLTVLYRPVRTHRARVGKCLIVRSARRGQVEIVRPARLQRELLRHAPLGLQLRYRRRYAVAGGVEVPVAVLPSEAGPVVPLRHGQSLAGGGRKRLSVQHNDLDAVFAAHTGFLQLQRNDLQRFRSQVICVLYLQHRAVAIHSCNGALVFIPPSAQLPKASDRLIHSVLPVRILSPGVHIRPILDIPAVLVRDGVPLVVLRHDAILLVAAASHSRGPHGIQNAVAGVTLSEYPALFFQSLPADFVP